MILRRGCRTGPLEETLLYLLGFKLRPHGRQYTCAAGDSAAVEGNGFLWEEKQKSQESRSTFPLQDV